MRKLIVELIKIYQKTLSPDHGWFRARYPYGFCRFYPTCSEYTKNVILRYGVIKGTIYGFLRVMRCNPLSNSRLDID